MQSDAISTLSSLTALATQWQTDAHALGVNLTLITCQIGGGIVVLAANEDTPVWDIRTQ